MNDTKVVNFHVVEDKGTTMTMQTQKNLKYDQKYETQWVSKEDYIEAGGLESDWGNVFNNTNKGPLTLLKTVESLTSSWTNVNNQTYALGTTIFKDNAYTGCILSTKECTENVYTLPSRTAKARILTAQEAYSLGCGSSASCPIWMYNYLSGLSDLHVYGYWTVTLNNTQGYAARPMCITYHRSLMNNWVDELYGIRPVVVVSK